MDGGGRHGTASRSARRAHHHRRNPSAAKPRRGGGTCVRRRRGRAGGGDGDGRMAWVAGANRRGAINTSARHVKLLLVALLRVGDDLRGDGVAAGEGRWRRSRRAADLRAKEASKI